MGLDTSSDWNVSIPQSILWQDMDHRQCRSSDNDVEQIVGHLVVHLEYAPEMETDGGRINEIVRTYAATN